MYMSWEDGETYVLDHKVVHKATNMLIVKCRMISKMAELGRDVLYKLYKHNDFCRLWLTLLVMLLHKMKSSSSSRPPDFFETFRRETTNPKVLRTFDSRRSTSLIPGRLESATRLDKWCDQTLHRRDLWWCVCCIIHLCLQCGHITPQCLLNMWWLCCEYYYKGHVLFTGLCYKLIWKCYILPLFLLCTLGVTYELYT